MCAVQLEGDAISAVGKNPGSTCLLKSECKSNYPISGKLLETTVKGALWHFGCKYYTYYKRSVFCKAVGIRAQLCTEGFGYMSNYQKPSKKQK